MAIEDTSAGAVTTGPGATDTADGVKPEAAAPAAPDAAVKPEEGAAPAEGENKDAADTPVEYKFTVPEGFELDQARTDEFVAIAKDLKLPADKAQAIVDLATKVEQQRLEQHQALVADWAKQAKEHKELGGDKLLENLAVAKKPFDLLPKDRADALKSILTATGLEAHPVMFELFHAMGKHLSEATFVPGKETPAPDASLAKRMFPNMK